MVSFFLEEDILSNNVKTFDIFGMHDANKNPLFHFLGHTEPCLAMM